MTGPSRTLGRLERLLRIVPWLLAHPGARTGDVAAAFDVDPAALEADLELLSLCGVPGYGGGDLVEVRIVDDRITLHLADALRDPLRLTAVEALALLLAARAVAALDDVAPPALNRAADRLAQALGADDAVVVDIAAPGAETLRTCQRAVVERRVLRLRYRDAVGNVTEREVEPWAITADRGAWYLQAHCRRAGAPRDFRLDRVAHLEATGETGGEPPADPAPPGYQPAAGDPRIEVAVRRDAAGVLDDLPGARVSAAGRGVGDEPDDDWLHASAPVGSLDWATRFVLAGGGAVRPLAPAELVEAVGQRARQARAALDEVAGGAAGGEAGSPG